MVVSTTEVKSGPSCPVIKVYSVTGRQKYELEKRIETRRLILKGIHSSKTISSTPLVQVMSASEDSGYVLHQFQWFGLVWFKNIEEDEEGRR